MAIDKMAGTPGMSPLKPTETANSGALGTKGSPSAGGMDFKNALDAQLAAVQNAMKPAAGAAAGGAEKLKFSNHAVERMRSRGVSFGADEMKNIENAVAKAGAKGSKDTLVLSGDKALIVSVKNNTVVTVMDREAMKDNVFTNIDSTVVV